MIIILWIVCFFMFVGASEIPTRRVYSNADGTIAVKVYSDKYIFDNETDKQYMDRIYLEENEINIVLGDIDVTNIPTDRSKREQWRVKEENGKKVVFVDPTAPSPRKDAENKKLADRNQAKAKLRSGQPISQAEIDALFPN